MNKYVADFETTTDSNDCRVWAFGSCPIDNPNKCYYGNSIGEFFDFIKSNNIDIIYFHNLKFDGEFIFYELFRQGFKYITNKSDKKNNTFTTLIGSMGEFYSITIYFKADKHSHKKDKKVLIYNSLNLLNFSVKTLAKKFGLEEGKGEIDYNKYRPIGYIITDEEKDYIRRDIQIVAKCLKILDDMKINKMTIASSAMSIYKSMKNNFNELFPKLTLDVDNYIRDSYRGGYVYVNPLYQNKKIKNGSVFDENSIYPNVMRNNFLPYGKPKYFKGKYKADKLYTLYIQKLTVLFKIKDNKLPTIPSKKVGRFGTTEYVTSSKNDIYTLTLTSVDLELFMENYDVQIIEYIDGYAFKSSNLMFKDYVDYWYNIKMEGRKIRNKGMEQTGKLMLNSLYGKFAMSPIGQEKYPIMKDDLLKYINSDFKLRDTLYIPVATFITSYARCKTIRNAQLYIDRFLYCDTDSIHLIGWEKTPLINIDNEQLGYYKEEYKFINAKYIRAKCYIDVKVDNELVIKCAGMSSECYKYVTFNNFKRGKTYKGKKQIKHVKNGIVLEETTFTIKD